MRVIALVSIIRLLSGYKEVEQAQEPKITMSCHEAQIPNMVRCENQEVICHYMKPTGYRVTLQCKFKESYR